MLSTKRLTIQLVLIFITNTLALSSGWEKINGPYGANITCIFPINQTEFLVGTKYSGLFIYKDNDKNWENVFYDYVFRGISSVIQLKNNTVLIEATTNLRDRSTIILKSTNDLKQWEFVNESVQGKFVLLHDSVNEYIFKLRGRTLGIIRSSDNGNSWVSFGPTTSFIEDILADTVNNLLYASSNSVIVDPLLKSSLSEGIFVSTDYGNSWSALFEESSDKIFSNNKGILVSPSWIFAEGYKSINYGNSWEQLSNQPYLLELSFLDTGVYGGGPDGLYHSNLDFESWEQLLPDIEINFIQPITSDKLIIGSINDIIVFNPQLKSFESIAEGLYEKQFFKILQTRGGTIFAVGFSGGLYKSVDEGENWERISQFFNGFEYGYYYGLLPERQIYDLAEDSKGNLFTASSVDDRFFFSQNKGITWDYVPLNTLPGDRIWSVAVDSTDYVYIGFLYSGVRRYNPSNKELIFTNLRGVATTVITVDKNNVVYAGSLLGRVYKTTDQGNNWFMVGNDTDTSAVNNIIVNEDVYITTYKGIYKLDNDQWIKIHGDLPNASIVNHSAYKDNILYVSLGEAGIYYTADKGNHWINYSKSLEQLVTDKLLVTSQNKLLVTTEQGIYSSSTIVSSVEDEYTRGEKPINFDTSVYPNPFNNLINIQIFLTKSEVLNLKIYDAIGNLIFTFTQKKFNAGINKVDWTGKNNNGKSISSGMYFLHITGGNISTTKKIIHLK